MISVKMLCRWLGPGDRLFPYMEVGDTFIPYMKVTFHLAFDDGKIQRPAFLLFFTLFGSMTSLFSYVRYARIIAYSKVP